MDHPPRIGLLLWRREYSWPAIVAKVQRYEAMGIDVVWVADHFAYPFDPSEPWFECWSLISALARETSQVRIGSLVSHLIYRNPALLARTAMTVDHISGGRLELGMGAGASEYDWTMTGSDPWPHRERAARLREGVEILDRMLREDLTSYEGRYYHIVEARMAPGPVQRPRPPLTIAAQGPVTVNLAAQYADAWNLDGSYWRFDPDTATDADIVRFVRGLSERLDEQAAAFGRDPSAITRSILAGFDWRPGLTAYPWSSVEAFQEFIGRYRELGFTEFIVPEPDGVNQDAVLAAVAGNVPPELWSNS